MTFLQVVLGTLIGLAVVFLVIVLYSVYLVLKKKQSVHKSYQKVFETEKVNVPFKVGELVRFKDSKHPWKIRKRLNNGCYITKGNAELFVHYDKISKLTKKEKVEMK